MPLSLSLGTEGRVPARAQEASQLRLQQQDNSATWDYVGDTDPDTSAHGGTASEGSGRGGGGNGGNGATDTGNGDGSEGASVGSTNGE